MKSFVFWLKYYRSLFLRVQLTITHDGLALNRRKSHYLNQCWPDSMMHICSTWGRGVKWVTTASDNGFSPVYDNAVIILCMRPAKERCYNVTSSPIRWAHTQNYPCQWWWIIFNCILKNIVQWNSNQITQPFCEENGSEIIVCELTLILFIPLFFNSNKFYLTTKHKAFWTHWTQLVYFSLYIRTWSEAYLRWESMLLKVHH